MAVGRAKEARKMMDWRRRFAPLGPRTSRVLNVSIYFGRCSKYAFGAVIFAQVREETATGKAVVVGEEEVETRISGHITLHKQTASSKMGRRNCC
jgi:hypothetical protein